MIDKTKTLEIMKSSSPRFKKSSKFMDSGKKDSLGMSLAGNIRGNLKSVLKSEKHRVESSNSDSDSIDMRTSDSGFAESEEDEEHNYSLCCF